MFKHYVLLATLVALISACEANKSSESYKSDITTDTKRDTSTRDTSTSSNQVNNKVSIAEPSVENPTTTKSLSSLITASNITFDESFRPQAKISLTNTTGKDIKQVVFRFDFAPYPSDGSSTNIAIYNDGASFTNLSVSLKAGESKSGQVNIPEPGHKDFETPNISVVKIRYADGSVQSEN